MYKLKIIDNTIGNYYEAAVYEFRRKHWWSFKKQWCHIYSHILGKKYMCPAIHQGLKTVEDLFERDLTRTKERYKFSETHNITISL